eukprot:2533281-Rhodomonas_salina.1
MGHVRRQMHVAIKLSWKSALTDIRKLDFQSAIPHVHTAVRNARHFKELAEQTEQVPLSLSPPSSLSPALPLSHLLAHSLTHSRTCSLTHFSCCFVCSVRCRVCVSASADS